MSVFTTVNPALAPQQSFHLSGLEKASDETLNKAETAENNRALDSLMTLTSFYTGVKHVVASPASQQEENMHYSFNASIVKYLLISHLPKDLFLHILIIHVHMYCKCKSIIQSLPSGFVILHHQLCPTTHNKCVSDCAQWGLIGINCVRSVS